MLGGKTKNDEIGARLKKARKDAGLTQVDVAKALGVTFGAVSQWENSQTSPKPPIEAVFLCPDFSALQALAKKL